ncbi:DUF3889 domain-containing protein [Brevibacillus agri]|uniref:DUF3889 domain-containing protein n=1 Tax=Brevibacillus agri TaxID=51101 RepID=UPI001F5CF1F0|nr:DUF3889 domain-containing protein [Brevibacillus agri]
MFSNTKKGVLRHASLCIRSPRAKRPDRHRSKPAVILLPVCPCLRPAICQMGQIGDAGDDEKYPHAQIVDYLHVGRTAKTPTTSEETFKLLLQEGNRRWALLVHIEFENQTEHVVQITYEESA